MQHSRRTLTSLAEEGCLDAGPEVAVRVSGPHRLQLVAAFFRLRERTARTDDIHQELPLSMLSVFKQTGFRLPASQDWTPSIKNKTPRTPRTPPSQTKQEAAAASLSLHTRTRVVPLLSEHGSF